ncbi:MAG: dephospho-CoA kinase [Oscillospiraceae bacterium]|nr:dephospho-CoA kinase [Oscillospiraceae bacterium]
MKIIGLTGLTGAGKSTVARKLMAYGCYHIDTDTVARDVINGDEKVKHKLKERFGDGVIGTDGSVNRPVLAKKAFADEESTNDLNAITHPAVTEKIKQIIDEKKDLGYSGIIIDAIALFESGEDQLCDFTVAVTAPEDIRLNRIIERDKITEEKAIERIRAQKSEEFFTKRADFIIWNYEPYNLDTEIRQIISNL